MACETKECADGANSAFEALYTPAGFEESYANLLDALHAVNWKLNRSGIKMPSEEALANTNRLYELVGRPLDEIPTVHVGGTNGKGTTCFKVSQCIHLSGLKVGLFVSPHISSFRERIQVGHELIPEAHMLEYLPRVLRLCVEHSIPATMFEITFILAALYFGEMGCDVAVVEVGVGGELDATNVIHPAVSVICSVALDHTRILGATVEEIAYKKGGIFKNGVPAIVGPSCPLQVLRDIAAARGAPLHTIESAAGLFSIPLPQPSSDDVDGGGVDPDAVNTFLCRAALRLLSAAAAAAAADNSSSNSNKLVSSLGSGGGEGEEKGCLTRPPCRWEELRVRVTTNSSSSSSSSSSSGGGGATSATTNNCGNVVSIERVDLQDARHTVRAVLDVGHNPAAVKALMHKVQHSFPADRGYDVRVVYAVSKDKNVRDCIRSILAVVPPEKVYFAQSSNWRAASQQELNAVFKEESGRDVTELAPTPVATGTGTGTGTGTESGVCRTLRAVLALAAESPSYATGKVVTVICGTGYIMPPARALLGVQEAWDETDLTMSTLPPYK